MYSGRIPDLIADLRAARDAGERTVCVMRARGSAALADNDLRMECERLPLHSFGYMVASRTQGFIPQPGGSMGNLCIAGTIGRFSLTAQNSGAVGAFTVPIDLSQLPAIIAPVTVGETLNFQAWFRDFTIIPTSNFTDAVAVTIE